MNNWDSCNPPFLCTSSYHIPAWLPSSQLGKAMSRHECQRKITKKTSHPVAFHLSHRSPMEWSVLIWACRSLALCKTQGWVIRQIFPGYHLTRCISKVHLYISQSRKLLDSYCQTHFHSKRKMCGNDSFINSQKQWQTLLNPPGKHNCRTRCHLKHHMPFWRGPSSSVTKWEVRGVAPMSCVPYS